MDRTRMAVFADSAAGTVRPVLQQPKESRTLMRTPYTVEDTRPPVVCWPTVPPSLSVAFFNGRDHTSDGAKRYASMPPTTTINIV